MISQIILYMLSRGREGTCTDTNTHLSKSRFDSSLFSSSNHHWPAGLCVSSGGRAHVAAVHPTLVRDGLILSLKSEVEVKMQT